jgi:thimet oligopeptidase
MIELGLISCRNARDISNRCETELSQARRILDAILNMDRKGRTIENTLQPYDELVRIVTGVSAQAELLFNVHPEAPVRDAAHKAYLNAEKLLTELSVNNSLYQSIKAIPLSQADQVTKYSVWKILRDFRLAGADRNEETRAKIKVLREEISEIGTTFERNISEDVRSIKLNPHDLAGLPEDYLDAHPPKDGNIVITTNYPDALPVFKYAHNEDVRRRLWMEFRGRAYPKNLEVLERLLERRHELACILDYDSFASLVTKNKMTGSAAAVRKFIDKLLKATKTRMRHDTELLLEWKRKDHPEASSIERWDLDYYTERIRSEQQNVDSKQIRSYFEFVQVRKGLFDLASRLFGVRFKHVNVKMWHESVETYDVYEGRKRLGRVYLDMHPRDGKYTHMASFPISLGEKSKELPQCALVCNFPDPTKSLGRTLMDHSDVTTLFHEFGHLLHMIFSGQPRWLSTSLRDLEWDFIEVPSELFEEWTVRPESLRRFAKDSTGETISIDLVERLRKSDSVARGLHTRVQIFLAAVSLAYYSQDPKSIDMTAVARELFQTYTTIPWPEGDHFQCSFGHLNAYSAAYYTYLWSQVIEKDLFSKFLASKTILDTKMARKYRRLILASGSKKPATEMVKQFLGRSFRTDHFQAWLNEGLD